MKQISTLQSLSDELLFEMFDYLDVFDLFYAFININQRLNQLITDHRIAFQADLLKLTKEKWSFYWTTIWPSIASSLRFLSIFVDDEFLRISLDLWPFRHLQSMKLFQIKHQQLKEILRQCQLRTIWIDTDFIQNEKHLRTLFDDLLVKQRRLQVMRCHFHTRIFFSQRNESFSRLRRLTIDDPCFSTDLVILIGQLPYLCYLNAFINDDRYDDLEKDVDYSKRNRSLHTLCLRIEKSSFEQLEKLLQSVPQIRRLQLKGAMKFDSQLLFELQQRHSNFRGNFHCETLF
jgi:hypothetical protein